MSIAAADLCTALRAPASFLLAARVPYDHQSYSESDRPSKKARTKYRSDIEKERGFYSTWERILKAHTQEGEERIAWKFVS
jgi:hypothetical protein